LKRIFPRAVKGYILFTVLLCLQSFQAASQADFSRFDPIISNGVASTGSADFIFIRNGNQLYEKNFASGAEKILPATRIKISSASIWLAAATVLTLVDKGYFTLDTEIGKILPQFKGVQAKITIRQLLSHTSGFPTNSIYLKDRSLTLAQSVDSIAQHVKLIGTPGKTFTYGAVSYQVAARISEVVSGKSWEQIFFEQIAKPCQMANTDFGKAKSVTIADAAYSTPKDYSNFLKMVLTKGDFNGVQVVSEKMITEMLTDHAEGLPLGYTPYKFKTAQNSRFYGLGVWIERIDVKTKIGTEVSCQGARGFTPWINTCKNTAAVFAVYGDLLSVQTVVDGLRDVIAGTYTSPCYDVSTENLTSLDALPANVKEAASAAANTVFISFDLDEDAMVTLKLFDPLGNEISTLINKQMKPGEHSVPLKTIDLPSGVYFYRLKVNERLETKKITIKK